MTAIAEVEKLAFSLPANERGELIEKLLRTLPPILYDEDGGLAEALRRDREMDENPEKIITMEQLDEMIANRPRRVRK